MIKQLLPLFGWFFVFVAFFLFPCLPAWFIMRLDERTQVDPTCARLCEPQNPAEPWWYWNGGSKSNGLDISQVDSRNSEEQDVFISAYQCTNFPLAQGDWDAERFYSDFSSFLVEQFKLHKTSILKRSEEFADVRWTTAGREFLDQRTSSRSIPIGRKAVSYAWIRHILRLLCFAAVMFCGMRKEQSVPTLSMVISLNLTTLAYPWKGMVNAP